MLLILNLRNTHYFGEMYTIVAFGKQIVILLIHFFDSEDISLGLAHLRGVVGVRGTTLHEGLLLNLHHLSLLHLLLLHQVLLLFY